MDTLESSIRKESERIIRAAKEKEISEIKELDEACAKEIEDFRKRIEAETKEKITEELSKLENKALLEHKKFKLRAIEEFITHIVEDVVKKIREDRRYKSFLLDALSNAGCEIGDRIEVYLTDEDRIFEKEIKEALTRADSNRNILIQEDKTIQWGGCIVYDRSGGRIFNSSLERVYFRKSSTIRREVMRMLKEQGFAI